MESEFSKNIVNWYPFQKNMRVLFIADAPEAIASSLRDNCKEVVVVTENLENTLCEGNVFDCMVFIGVIGILPRIMPNNPTLEGLFHKVTPYLAEHRENFIGN